MIRFETEPGIQMQVDFAHFKHNNKKFYAFVAILGYSRMSYVEFVLDQSIDTVIKCHENAFEYFGGVPYNGLYDNMKTVILERDFYAKGAHKLHPAFYDFAKHYGFIPRICKPYNPQTKGKVERMIPYLRYSFYIGFSAGKSNIEISDLNASVVQWLDEVAHERVHATTQDKPIKRWVVEKQNLLKTPNNYSTSYGEVKNHKTTTTKNTHIMQQNTQSLQHELNIYESLLSSGGAA